MPFNALEETKIIAKKSIVGAATLAIDRHTILTGNDSKT